MPKLQASFSRRLHRETSLLVKLPRQVYLFLQSEDEYDDVNHSKDDNEDSDVSVESCDDNN